MKPLHVLTASLLFSLFSVHANGAMQNTPEDREPEAATGTEIKQAVISKEYMVVAANPYASWAGNEIIQRGGSAIDAAIAVQSMLTLVEPQSSGIGGGAFILYWDNEKKRLHTFDGREIAPKASNAYTFTKEGQVMSWRDAVVGGKSVGVPGVMRALELAHNKFGSLKWSDLFLDTIDIAREGFIVSERLSKLISLDYHPGVNEFATTKAYFKPKGTALVPGAKKHNPELANILTKIALNGADYMYKGPLADKIVTAVNTATINPGLITVTDLASYKAKERAPVCGQYRTKKICGMAPPSSGGVNVFQILKLLERFDLSQYSIDDPEFIHLYTQASALAFADREYYIADSDFTHLSHSALISDMYLRERSKLISPNKTWKKFAQGSPYKDLIIGEDTSPELPSTSHFSIVDKKGNAISMTTSVEFMFGSGLMVEGFMLNNQLTDFSLSPSINGSPALNRLEPGKRPRSSMSPTMVFSEDGKLELVLGSPGGSRIINYVAQTIIGVVDWDMDIQQSINMPKLTNRNDYTALEKGTSLAQIAPLLIEKGHDVKVIDLNSGLHGIEVKKNNLVGGADPRREGEAVGF